MQYIYGYHELDAAPDSPTSARVQPRRTLSGDTFETAKSSTIGAVLFGEHVAVALVMQAAGSGAKAHTHPKKISRWWPKAMCMPALRATRNA